MHEGSRRDDLKRMVAAGAISSFQPGAAHASGAPAYELAVTMEKIAAEMLS